MGADHFFSTSELSAFDAQYDSTIEDDALCLRGEFLRTFPIRLLTNMTLDEYVIGRNEPTFCYYIEVRTKKWANIVGSTALKFGIYYGKTKSDPKMKYRFSKKFGKTPNRAFTSIKNSLIELINLGSAKTPDFELIDKNKLSQMLKAKVLSLYFPNKFINVCSGEHLEEFAELFGLVGYRYLSEIQHELLNFKNNNNITREWSNPKFMLFIYRRQQGGAGESKFKKIDLEKLLDRRNEIGKAAEKFALAYEKDRLLGAEYGTLIERIEDCRAKLGCGYDFLSFNSDREGDHRKIEVKAISALNKHGIYRFFISENELKVAESSDNKKKYYFYLVKFNEDGKPSHVYTKIGGDLLKTAARTPASYKVFFEL
jgi:hypothetical protein